MPVASLPPSPPSSSAGVDQVVEAIRVCPVCDSENVYNNEDLCELCSWACVSVHCLCCGAPISDSQTLCDICETAASTTVQPPHPPVSPTPTWNACEAQRYLPPNDDAVYLCPSCIGAHSLRDDNDVDRLVHPDVIGIFTPTATPIPSLYFSEAPINPASLDDDEVPILICNHCHYLAGYGRFHQP